MPICFTFIGWHNSGKTSLAQKIVKAFVQKGLKVGVIKSTKHSSIAEHPVNSDSYKLKNAGAYSVALACPDQLILFRPDPKYRFEYLAFKLFPEADLVIGEGFKNDPDALKIEVTRQGVGEGLLADKVPNVVAIVADFDTGRENSFHVDDINGIVQFIENRFMDAKDMEPKAEMFGDKKKIFLKYFVRKALTGLLFGFATSLKGTENIKSIEIKAELDKKSL